MQESLFQHKTSLTLLCVHLLNFLILRVITDKSLAVVSASFHYIPVTTNDGTFIVELLVCRTEVLVIGVEGEMTVVPTTARTADTDAIDHYNGHNVLCNSQTNFRWAQLPGLTISISIFVPRSMSLMLVSCMFTILLSSTLPIWIITVVEIMFSTNFCAVPLFILVLPVTNSGPTTTSIG